MGRWAGQLGLPMRGALWAALVLVAVARPPSAEAGEGTGLVEPIAVPSGVAVAWLETLSDLQGPAGLTLRFRFVAPQIGALAGGYTPDMAAADMQALCDGFALPRLPDAGPQPAQVVITLADRPVPFGEIDEEAVQFFEAYSIEDGACLWEMF